MNITGPSSDCTPTKTSNKGVVLDFSQSSGFDIYSNDNPAQPTKRIKVNADWSNGVVALTDLPVKPDWNNGVVALTDLPVRPDWNNGVVALTDLPVRPDWNNGVVALTDLPVKPDWNNGVTALIDLPVKPDWNNGVTALTDLPVKPDWNNGVTALTNLQVKTGMLFTNSGYLQTTICGPRLPFGSIHAERMTPIFQSDFVHGMTNDAIQTSLFKGATVSASDSLCVISSGTTSNARGEVYSRKRVRYRPGCGMVARFTGIFQPNSPNCYQLAGMSNGEDGYFFGYKGNDFGIIWRDRGVRECRTLTITNGGSTATSCTVTLDGVAYVLTITTAASNLNRLVYELSKGNYTSGGWRASISGAGTLVFVSDFDGPRNGTYSFVKTSAVGTFSATAPGVVSTETFIPQTSWNLDKLDGTGDSGFVADWAKGNVFQINMQYLGFGSLLFFVEVTFGDPNVGTRRIPEFQPVHVIENPGTLTRTHIKNPNLYFSAFVASTAITGLASTTNVALKTASFAFFIEGEKVLHGTRYSYRTSSTTVGSTNEVLLILHNPMMFNGMVNQIVSYVINISIAFKHNTAGTIFMTRGSAVSGNPIFSQFTANSPLLWETSSQSATIQNNEIIWTAEMSDTVTIVQDFTRSPYEEITIQPGEYLVISAQTLSQTANYCSVCLNMREDI